MKGKGEIAETFSSFNKSSAKAGYETRIGNVDINPSSVQFYQVLLVLVLLLLLLINRLMIFYALASAIVPTLKPFIIKLFRQFYKKIYYQSKTFEPIQFIGLARD